MVTLIRTKDSAVIRIDAKDFTDYAAVSFGAKAEGSDHTFVVSDAGPSLILAYKNYGYARIANNGSVTLRGDWTGLTMPAPNGPVTLNGKEGTASLSGAVFPPQNTRRRLIVLGGPSARGSDAREN